MKFYHQLINVFGLNEHWKDTCFPLYNSIKEFTENNSIDPYHSLSKQKILPVEPLIQCEAGRAKTMQRQSLYSPRTPKWPPSDKRELIYYF